MDMLNFLVNFVCYIGIVVLALYDGVTYWTHGGRNHVSLKGEMTGVGILGTFCGIFIGLVHFDVTNISGSVPPLLEGLKTAFGTSIVGLLFSTGLTVAQAIKPVAFSKTGDPIADTLVRVFQEFEPVLRELRDATKANTVEIVAMRQSMDKTMEDLAKGVTTEIVKALEGVISDFNTNLKEQFGENFKRLNEACFKLVEWQENHVNTVDSSVEAFDKARVAFETLKAQSSAMIDSHNELLQSLQRVGADARGLEGASKGIASATEELEATIARTDRLLETVEAKIEATETLFNNTLDGFDRKTMEVADDTKKKVSGVTAHISKELEVLPRIGEEIKAAASGAVQAAKAAEEANEIAARTVTLTRGEMETAHRNLEQALVALTNGFGIAYREYLEGLRKLADK
jgi:hypothetical protein